MVYCINFSSTVSSPHHLVSECVEEYVIRPFYYLNVIVRFTDSQTGSFPTCFTASVNRYQEVVAPAFHIEGDFPIIVDDNRADVEAMGSYRSNGKGLSVTVESGTQDGADIDIPLAQHPGGNGKTFSEIGNGT